MGEHESLQPGGSRSCVSNSRACSLNLEVSCLRGGNPIVPRLLVTARERWPCTRATRTTTAGPGRWPRRQRGEVRRVLDPDSKVRVWVWARPWHELGCGHGRPMARQSCQKPQELWESNGMNGCKSALHTLRCVMKKQRGFLTITTVVIVGLGAGKNWTLGIPFDDLARPPAEVTGRQCCPLRGRLRSPRCGFPILILPITSPLRVSASSSVKLRSNYWETKGDADCKMLSPAPGTAQGNVSVDGISLLLIPKEVHSPERCSLQWDHTYRQWCLTTDRMVERCPRWNQKTPAKSWAL